MKIKFKLIFEGEPDLQIDNFRQSLPKNFSVSKEKDGFYILVVSDKIQLTLTHLMKF